MFTRYFELKQSPVLPVSRAALAALCLGKPMATSMSTNWLSTSASSFVALPAAAAAGLLVCDWPDDSAGCDRSQSLLCSVDCIASTKSVMCGATSFSCSTLTDPLRSTGNRGTLIMACCWDNEILVTVRGEEEVAHPLRACCAHRGI